MSNKPLVSAIIIFLNEERFLPEAIESVLAQTYENWELLLVDDGSTDGSTQIALNYAERHPGKVRYLEHPDHQNRAMSASRNLGIEHAKGEYIAFLDADDVWLAHKLEQQVSILEEHPEAAMLYGNAQYWYGWTGEPEDIERDSIPKLGVQPNTLFEPPALLTLLFPFGTAPAPAVSNFILRSEVVQRVGEFEEAFTGMFQDQVFFSKVYLKEPVFVAAECWSKYRQHPDSCFSVWERTGQLHSSRLLYFDWLEKYLSEQGIKDTKLWKLLREEQIIAEVRSHAYKREWKQAMRGLLVLLRYYPRAFVRNYQKLRLRMQLRRRLSW